MSLRKVTLLGSNLASVMDLKRIQTPHSLCCDFRASVISEAHWLGGRVQVWVQVWALQVIWQFLWRLFQKVIKGLEGKFNGQALWAALLLCLRWSDGPAQTVFPRWWQLMQAATGLLEKNMLTLLQYRLCSRVNNVLMFFNLLAATNYFFFYVKWKFQLIFFFHVKWKFQWVLLTKAAPIALLNLSISHWSHSKNITKEQKLLFQMESCAKQHV